ncbi:MAG: DHH family phosphoesterase [Desulfurococcaceae archaeon]
MPSTMDAIRVLWAKLAGKQTCLSHSSDADGVVCAALFLRALRGRGVVVLAEPYDIQGGGWLNLFKWDYVMDLPCPSKALAFVDHHKTNRPSKAVERLYHDPSAPSAAALAIRALNLENDDVSLKLVELANECDMANIKSEDAWNLNDAVKGCPKDERLNLARLLSTRGLEAFEVPEVKGWIARNRARRERTQELADKIPVEDNLFVILKDENHISTRSLMITLEKKGCKLTCVVTSKNGKYKVHLGSREDSGVDCSRLASLLGGGGHERAAGATVNDLKRALGVVAEAMMLKRVRVYVVDEMRLVEAKNFEVDGRVLREVE